MKWNLLPPMLRNVGMVVFAASGDNDSSDGGPTPANVDAPSSCPHAVGCGGTYKTTTVETVWNDSPGADQRRRHRRRLLHHLSRTELANRRARRRPLNSPYGKGRMVPDVSGDADPNTGYDVVVHGTTTVVGGTSAVAPLYAGLFAAFGKKLGFVTPSLYQNQADFNDITGGGNGLYNAAPGPDPCTGIGSPIGNKLAALFVKPA